MADLENKNTNASEKPAKVEKAPKAEKKPKKDKVKLSTRIATAFRSYKSEVKKIVWSPWNQVRKNTLVVVVVIVASAAAVGVLDYVFTHGLIALGGLVR